MFFNSIMAHFFKVKIVESRFMNCIVVKSGDFTIGVMPIITKHTRGLKIYRYLLLMQS